jgi:hypothetical protein
MTTNFIAAFVGPISVRVLIARLSAYQHKLLGTYPLIGMLVRMNMSPMKSVDIADFNKKLIKDTNQKYSFFQTPFTCSEHH